MHFPLFVGILCLCLCLFCYALFLLWYFLIILTYFLKPFNTTYLKILCKMKHSLLWSKCSFFHNCFQSFIFFFKIKMIAFIINLRINYTIFMDKFKVSKGAKIRNRYNQVPHLTQDTNWKVTNSEYDTTNQSQEVSPFQARDHKAHINRRSQRHSKHKTEQKHKRSTK